MIQRVTIDVTSAGSDGSAVGNTDSPQIQGEILAVHLAYTGQPSTADVTLKMVSPEQTILTVGNANSNGWFYPRVAVQDNLGAGVTFDGTNEAYEPFPVHGKLNLAVAEGNDEGTVRAEVLYRVGR